MNTPIHDWHRLHHTGMRGLERHDKALRRYHLAGCLILTAGIIAALVACGMI